MYSLHIQETSKTEANTFFSPFHLVIWECGCESSDILVQMNTFFFILLFQNVVVSVCTCIHCTFKRLPRLKPTHFFSSSIWLFGSVVASMYTFSTIIHFCFDKKKELNWTRTACGLIIPWVKE